MKNKLDILTFIEKANEIHNHKYDYSKVSFRTSKDKIIIICKKHGEFSQRVSAHIGSQKQGCKKCANDSYKKGVDWFLTNAKKIHGDKYDYSLINDIIINKPVDIICKKHGIFKQKPSHHIHRAQNCPKCSDKTKSNDNFIELSIIKHGSRYDYSLVNYVNNKTKVKIICPVHGIFEQMAGSHLCGYGCTFCKESKGEKEIRKILNKNNILFIPQHSFNECKNILPLLFDFYLPEYNICVEFNGRQHYESISHFGGEQQLLKQQKNDKIKMEYCNKNNIPLIIIKYDDKNLEDKLRQFNVVK